MNKIYTNKGFTLIEILIVMGIIAILASIVIVAINPARQFAQARNTQRQANVSTILNAIGQNMVDNKGSSLSETTCTGIGTPPESTELSIGTAPGLVNLTCLVPTYIAYEIPFDPDGGSSTDTKYTIKTDATGRYTVCAPKHAESAISGSTTYCFTR